MLDENCMLEVGAMKLTANQVASRYKPIVRQRIMSPNQPLKMTCEIIDEEARYVINYSIVWPDEINPIPLLNTIYKLFRVFYYGSAYDIELIQLAVNKISGAVSEVLFETEPEPEGGVFPSHARAILRRLDDAYALVVGSRDLIEAGPVFRNERIEILASSWNHEFCIHFSHLETEAFDLPLEFLTDYEYITQRYATRREANLRYPQKMVTRILLTCWFILSPLLALPHLLQSKMTSRMSLHG